MLYRFRHRILGPLVILWLVLTVASVVKLATVWNGLSQALHASTEAATISEALNKVYSDLQLAESSQTSYLLTGSTNFIDTFEQAEAAKNENFSHLATLIGNDRNLQSDLSELRGLVESKMGEMKETVRLRREKNLTAAANFAISVKGKDAMDRIQLVEQRMRERRLDLISNAGEAMQRRFQQGQVFGLLTGAIGIGAGLFALFLIWEGYRQMQSQQKLLEDKLKAEETVVEKSAFLANMSHEIRTPMNAILGFGELLEQEPLTPRQAQYARSIRQSGNSLLRLINDVLDLSKMEAGKMELLLEPTDVRELCGFLQTMFAQLAAAKSIRLELEIGRIPRALMLDRMRLRQILVNLVGNAVKFTEQGSVKVTVNWQPGDQDRSRGVLAFDVSDTGVGISKEKQEEIFKPFVQSEPGRAAENEGSGLGLSIVQRLLEMMGGTITLDSSPGNGSTFHIRLPNVAISARLPVADATDEVRVVNFNDFKPATILVVDDNDTNIQLLVGIFERTHHELLTATGGKPALELLATQIPDIILLDIRMAGMDGFATLDEIRKLPGTELIPVIALTASTQSTGDTTILENFNALIRKPYSRATLYRELTDFLPRISATSSAANGASLAPVTNGAETAKVNGHDKGRLMAALGELRANEWPVLRETLAIRDSRVFAEKLRSLARMNSCPKLSAYADVLSTHAETYSVAELEKHLAEFPGLVEAIERNGDS